LVQLSVFALQLPETTMPPHRGPREESQQIASRFHPAFNANFLAGMLCGFFSVKRKLFRLESHLRFSPSGDSHCSGVKPPKTFPSVSRMSVSVFARPPRRP
jgi:hypothetical protein